MGDQTDLALEAGDRQDADELFESINRKMAVEELGYDPETHWKTQDGRLYLPKEMKDSHLQNTVSMLKRKKHTSSAIYSRLCEELESRDILSNQKQYSPKWKR